VDPRGVEGILSLLDFQKARRLHEPRLAESGNLEQLPPAPERPVLDAVFVNAAGREVVQPCHIPEQRRARRIQVDAYVVDARLDHRIERRPQVLGLHIVRIEPHADVRRIDFHQLAQRILQAPPDGDGAADHRIVVGQLFARERTCRVHARAGFVDDHVREIAVAQLAGNQVGDELFGLAAGRSVADGDDRDLMIANHRCERRARFLFALVRTDHVNQVVRQHAPERIQGREFAAVFETGIDRQQAPLPHRRLQEQVAEIAREDFDGVKLRLFGKLATNLAFEARNDKPREGVADASFEKIPMRMLRRHELLQRFALDGFVVGLDFDAQDLRFFSPIDRQDAVRRYAANRLAKVEVIAERFGFLFVRLTARADQLSRAAVDLAHRLPEIGPFAELFGQNVPRPEKRIGRGGHSPVLADEIGRASVEVRGGAVGGEDFLGQRFQPLLARGGGSGLLLGFERQV